MILCLRCTDKSESKRSRCMQDPQGKNTPSLSTTTVFTATFLRGRELCFSPAPLPCFLTCSYPMRRVNILVSLRYRRTHAKQIRGFANRLELTPRRDTKSSLEEEKVHPCLKLIQRHGLPKSFFKKSLPLFHIFGNLLHSDFSVVLGSRAFSRPPNFRTKSSGNELPLF